MGLHYQVYAIEDGKSINNVGAQFVVNVLWLILSNAWPIPSPIGEVANHLVIPTQLCSRWDLFKWLIGGDFITRLRFPF